MEIYMRYYGYQWYQDQILDRNQTNNGSFAKIYSQTQQ